MDRLSHVKFSPAHTVGLDRLPSVDLLRTTSFFLVVLSHFGGMFYNRLGEGQAVQALSGFLSSNGSLGTNTFFLLSAFLLIRSLNAGSAWRDAVGRRLKRLYPGFLLILGLYTVLAQFVPNSKVPTDPGEALLYIAANALLLPGLLPMQPVVTVTWSLSYVVLSYAMFGAIYHYLGLRQRTGQVRFAVFVGLAGALWVAAQFGFPHLRLIYFPLGAAMAELGSVWPRPSWKILAVSAALFYGLNDFRGSGILGLTLTVAAAIACPWVNQVAGAVGVRMLAEISYAVFLTHGIVLRSILRLNPPRLEQADMVALYLVGLAAIVATAILARSHVFQPIESWLSSSGAASRRTPTESVAGGRVLIPAGIADGTEVPSRIVPLFKPSSSC